MHKDTALGAGRHTERHAMRQRMEHQGKIWKVHFPALPQSFYENIIAGFFFFNFNSII